MAVTIRNMERRMKVINLPHESYCKSAGQCSCDKQTVTVVVQDPRTGERNLVSRDKRIPSSLTLLSQETRKDLPEAVLEVPEVKRALRAGRLRVIEQKSRSKEEPPADAGATEPAAAVEQPAGDGSRKRKKS